MPLPQTFTYGVEVRHPAFFNKGETEKALNRGLHQQIQRLVLLWRLFPPADAQE
jgi:uncharacterized protein YecE (DUF72 family)